MCTILNETMHKSFIKSVNSDLCVGKFSEMDERLYGAKKQKRLLVGSSGLLQ
ncbi:hypothetical protein BSM4216_2888 [Bacillus smithii]|nr:hypothetical protein BSM4216_2888 [Bacillus smithii]